MYNKENLVFGYFQNIYILLMLTFDLNLNQEMNFEIKSTIIKKKYVFKHKM